MKVLLFVALMVACVAGFGRNCDSPAGRMAKENPKKINFPTETAAIPVNYKVAFLGDVGSDYQQRDVLTYLKNWGAQVVVHSGDFEYLDNAALFESQLNEVLGPDFPYFTSIGNHDEYAWEGPGGHKERLTARMQRFGGDLNCTGDIGVNMACLWNGLYVVFSGVGTYGSGHEEFLDEAFSVNPSVWKIASWHKNQRLMQIGGKSDEVGWDAYDIARKHGAMIATGHEHSYCRSYMMSDFRNQLIANKDYPLRMEIGESFVFVSGVGGKDIRFWDETLRTNQWWASVGAADNGIIDGALLCIFNQNGNPRNAHCEQHDRLGKIWDSFDITTTLPDNKEELDQALTRFAEKASPCRNPFLEIPVSQGHHDMEEDAEGQLHCRSRAVNIGLRSERRRHSRSNAEIPVTKTISLRFDNVPLKKGGKIQQAFLQVYGAGANEKVTPKFVIRGSDFKGDFSCGRGSPKHQLATLPLTNATVTWEHEDEGWEIHTVWVSADLKEVISEIINQPGWEEGNPITLVLTGEGERSFYSFDKSPCFAPTLAIELEEQC